MLTVEKALAEVLERVAALAPRQYGLEQALGCVLAEDVAADLDLPPFDKALVDGFAVRLADLAAGVRRLRVGQEITAGAVPAHDLAPGEAALVMTGAPLPGGTDLVVMVEHAKRRGNEVTIDSAELVAPGRNVLARGREVRAEELVLRCGELLTPARLGLMAAVGRTEVSVVPRPSVAVVPTGDELVEPSEQPGPGQIRNSNAATLRALAARCEAQARVLPIARDEAEPLRQALEAGLDDDVLLVSGGVSAGTHDLVPAALTALGVERAFHKVSIKPGKPLWFGVGPARVSAPGTLVFGLPGNPVSSLVCFLVFVRPALQALRGEAAGRAVLPAHLALAFTHHGDRPTYHPAKIVGAPGGGPLTVEPLEWAGSADLRAVARADGFAIFPAGDRAYVPGAPVGFLPLP